MVLCTFVDEGIIPGVEQWHKGTSGSILWV